MKKSIYFYYLIFSVLLVSCSEEISSPYEPLPQVELHTIEIPYDNSQANDYGALKTLAIINRINKINNYKFYFDIPKNAASRGNNQLIFERNGLTTKYDFFIEDGWYEFQIYLSGNIDGYELNNFNFIYGSVGDVGNRTVIDLLSYDKLQHENWSYYLNNNSNRSLEVNYTDYIDRYLVVENNDGSGRALKTNSSRQIEFESAWSSDGSGNWKEYENGSVVNSGAWN